MNQIKNMYKWDQPREKAFHFGLHTLSNAELLAILLRTGTKDKSVLDVAKDLLEKFDGLTGVLLADMDQLTTTKGISKVKALELLTICELQKRMSLEVCLNKNSIHGPQDIVEWLESEIGYSSKEEFIVIFLDNANHILSYQKLFQGTINKTQVYMREIIKEALLKGSCRLIIAHNHPSGSLDISNADYQFTQYLDEVGKLMEIEILDHLIITRNGYHCIKNNETY